MWPDTTNHKLHTDAGLLRVSVVLKYVDH